MMVAVSAQAQQDNVSPATPSLHGMQRPTQGNVPGSPDAMKTIDGSYIPNPPEPFRGTANFDMIGSKPFEQKAVGAKSASPNLEI
jgi:hypothetical protein